MLCRSSSRCRAGPKLLMLADEGAQEIFSTYLS